jgi:hypothetical protein
MQTMTTDPEDVTLGNVRSGSKTVFCADTSYIHNSPFQTGTIISLWWFLSLQFCSGISTASQAMPLGAETSFNSTSKVVQDHNKHPWLVWGGGGGKLIFSQVCMHV